LAISGPAGSGKSTLCGWIIEKLQRPLGKRTFKTLTCHVEADVPGEATSCAIAKRLVLQLLEKDVGNRQLFREIEKAYNIAASTDATTLEGAFWKCLDVGLELLKRTGNVIIVIDGLDNIRGGEKAANEVVNHLSLLAVKHSQRTADHFVPGCYGTKQGTQPQI
jgi:cytidylate kinase